LKNSTFLLFAVFVCLILGNTVNAQQPTHRTCASDEVMQRAMQDPQVRARVEAYRQQFDGRVNEYLANRENRTQAIINVPVVVHIMTDNPSLVTDATVQRQIDTLNWFYGGASATDSLRTYTPFRDRYGRTEIRFCLAKRTPAGLPTNGIDRTTTAATFTATSGVHPNTVVPAWNTQKYLNIWVVVFSDNTLGYAYYPTAFPAGDARYGFVNDYRAFGAGAPYLFNLYNEGKTAVHEIGHYFNLAHTFGPNGQSNPSCLDDGVADTPLTNTATFGCPASPVTNSCSPTAPGIMFQNHMDYADDRCMVLFTQGQAARMMTSITTMASQTGLLTSDGCTPVSAATNDIRVLTILNPPNASTVSCVPLTPRVTVRNDGTNSVTGFNVNVRLDGVLVGTQSFTTTLASGASTDLTLNLVPISPAVGNHTLKIHTTDPNLAADAVPANDTAVSLFTRNNGTVVPLVEGFEGAAYPPGGWVLNAGTTWQKTTPGSASTNSIYGDFFDISSGTVLDLTSPVINVAGLPGGSISFDLAHKQWSATLIDRLQVFISTDCGTTFTTVVYDKTSSTGLSTVAGLGGSEYTPAGAGDWRKENITLPASAFSTGILQVRFKGTSGFGNNLFIDNINIDKQFDRDLSVIAITRPGANECGPFAPIAQVKNLGVQAVTSYSITYRIDGGPLQTTNVAVALASGATANITLTNANPAAGNHTIQVCAANVVSASGTGDQNTGNDCLSKAFLSRAVSSTPLVEGFEATSFPSPGWSIVNPDNDITWVRKGGTGFNSDNSAFIDHFNFITIGQQDNVQSPAFLLTGVGGVLADSVIVTWDLAHQNYPGAFDEFAVLASSDCGNTYPTILFDASGATLAGPAGANTADYLAPLPAHWQHLRRAIGGAPLANGNMLMRFRTINDFGNNIFLDNINIQALFKRDLKVEAITRPNNVECTGSFTPTATVRNSGIETITAFTISYRLDNGAAQTTTVTGVTLARNATMQVNLTAIANLGAGQHSIQVFSNAPALVTTGGTADQLTTNDTLSKGFGITGTTAAPLTEAFESATFPPAGWAIGNPDANITWSKATSGARNSTGSAYMNNYNYSILGRTDELYSPSITYSGVDSVTLSFDVAAATYSYPGTTGIALDTLEVLVTKDCGNTFTSVWKKWGEDLQTINDPNYPQTVEFIPGSASQWRNEVVDLTTLGFVPNGPVQLIFRNTNNFENNIFLDNVNLTTRTLPNTLKEQGYLILPNPFNTEFTVWHLNTPTNLRFVSVYNSAGQLVWKKQFNGDATKQVVVNLDGKPAGMYIVNLGYSDRVRDTQVKVIKAQ
jgi:hypothetical protein